MQNVSSSASVSSSSATNAAPVVQNDTSVVATAAKYTFERIEQLAIDRQAWETTVYRTSNEMLYGLLQKCYQLYKDMEGKGDDAKKLRDSLNSYVSMKGYKFLKSTHTLSKIVKCVFSNNTSNEGTDRRRVSAYSVVLQKALSDGIAVDGIAAFINDAGGVEAIRLGKKPSGGASPAKQKVVEAKANIAQKSVGMAMGLQLSAQLDAGKIGTQVVLIGTWQPDGSVVVQAVVQNDTALNAALASYHSESKLKPEAKTQAVEKEAANDANAIVDAHDQAVAEALAA
jgi:hypothetical protein